MAGLLEPSLSMVSVGLLNQLLHFLGKSGKTEAMIKVIGKKANSMGIECRNARPLPVKPKKKQKYL